MTTLTINGTMTLGELLAFYRQRAGLDQTEMGERVGASRPTVSAWERGAREPNFSQVVAWARVAGQPLEPLVATVSVNEETSTAEAMEVTERAPRDSNPRPSDP